MKKDQNTYARWASTLRSGGFFGVISKISPSPFRERVGRGFKGTNLKFLHGVFPMEKFRKVKCRGSNADVFHYGRDAAAFFAVKGTADAGNAKGVFYDN